MCLASNVLTERGCVLNSDDCSYLEMASLKCDFLEDIAVLHLVVEKGRDIVHDNNYIRIESESANNALVLGTGLESALFLE